MNPDQLKEIQRRGWAIEAVDANTCTVKCPTPGCQMRARFKDGGAIPLREVPGHRWDLPVKSFDDARETLKTRRQEIGLTIAEVEHISGIAGDHLAKFERVNWDKFPRMPNVETFIEWANSLGFEVVLRHGELPAITLRWIADTRSKSDARRRRFEIERGRDRARQPADPLAAERDRLVRQADFIARQMEEVDAEIAKRDQGSLFGGFEDAD